MAEILVKTPQEASLKAQGKKRQFITFDAGLGSHAVASTTPRIILPTSKEITHFGQQASIEAPAIPSDKNGPERLEWLYTPDDLDMNVGRLRPGGPPILPPPDEPLHDGEPRSPRDNARRVLLSALEGRPAYGAYVAGLIDMIETRSMQLFIHTRQEQSVKQQYTTRLQRLSERRSRQREAFPGYREGAMAFEEIYEAYTQAGKFYTDSGNSDEEHAEKQLNGLNLLRDDYHNLGKKDIIASNGRRYTVITGFVPAITDGQWGELEGVSIQQQRHTLWCGYADVSAMLQYQGYKDQTQEDIFRGMHGPYFYEREESRIIEHKSPAYGFFAKYGQDLSDGELKADLYSYKTMATILAGHPGHSALEMLDLYVKELEVPVMIRIPTHNLLVVGVNSDAENPYYTVINPSVGARRALSPADLLQDWAASDPPGYPYDGRYQMLAFRPRARSKSA